MVYSLGRLVVKYEGILHSTSYESGLSDAEDTVDISLSQKCVYSGRDNPPEWLFDTGLGANVVVSMKVEISGTSVVVVGASVVVVVVGAFVVGFLMGLRPLKRPRPLNRLF